MTTRRLLFILPVLVLLASGVGFWSMLSGMRGGTFDPRGVPSALVGRPIPVFTLDPIAAWNKPGLSSADIVAAARGRPVLLNFFASWCAPCLVEHPNLMKLAAEGVPMFGINYHSGSVKDPEVAAWLRRHGDPFRAIGLDITGRVGVDFGAYGVPETYLIDREGIVRWRMAGPVTEEILRDQLRPLLARLK